MGTSVTTYSYTHSVTFVTDNILRSLKDIVRLSGLNPAKLADQWSLLDRAISTWLNSGHLKQVTLEIHKPGTTVLVGRWDLDILRATSYGNGEVWADIDSLRYAIRKAGMVASDLHYRVLLDTEPGEPYVPGMSSTSLMSTDGMRRLSIGPTIEHGGLGASAAYWRAS